MGKTHDLPPSYPAGVLMSRSPLKAKYSRSVPTLDRNQLCPVQDVANAVIALNRVVTTTATIVAMVEAGVLVISAEAETIHPTATVEIGINIWQIQEISSQNRPRNRSISHYA